MKQLMEHILRISAFLAALLLAGCRDNTGDLSGGGNAVLYLSIKAAANSINEDEIDWEDRVDELRMIVFDPADGGVVYNQKLYFPDGFQASSRPVEITPGTYDFYFIANETVYPGNFVDALMQIENLSDFTTDARFSAIAYRPGFSPDGTTTPGRFLMSAVYEGITVASGGTYTNPVALPLPTEKVELIRALAKVEVVFRKRVSGGTVPENTVTDVHLENVAAYTSVPPADSYYTGSVVDSRAGSLDGLDYGNDSIGSVVFYIPELLVAPGGDVYTELVINNNVFPIETDDARGGLAAQRRSVPATSDNSVIRNYHYLINAYIASDGGLQLLVYVQPWQKDTYLYIFQGDASIVLPPVTIPSDTTIIFPTDCGKIELLSHNEYLTAGLQGAYNDQVIYYDPETQGSLIIRGDPPYYCEKKYGEGWRLINSCELMSFLAYFDTAYNVWTSNTWNAVAYDMPYYSMAFREEAQYFLEKLTGYDLSGSVLYDQNNHEDALTDLKLGIVDEYFTPGDIMVKEDDYPGGWPFPSPPGTDLTWFYNEVTIQVKVYWYGSEYISYSDRDNWNEILYGEFERYDYSSTVSRCVRDVD
ncbi:MAG: FimB/Mfa2 family fimbrial subunit [Rikenellaceae bacterium]|nr:FimB/Mfa2 family fimbrial subunit [Rikenellaceae bacterium]